MSPTVHIKSVKGTDMEVVLDQRLLLQCVL